MSPSVCATWNGPFCAGCGPVRNWCRWRPNALADVWTSIEQVGDALKVPERGADVIRRLQSRIRAIAERTRDFDHRPTVACIEWIDPLMAAGNWMPEMVEMAGGVNVFGVAVRIRRG